MKIEHKVVVVSIAFGLFVWVIDAVWGYVFLEKGTLLGLLITDVPRYELYLRSVVMACFVLFSIPLSRVLAEQRRAEEALRQSEERYRSLVDRVPIGLYRATPAGQILDTNPALVTMLGYPDRESLMAVNVTDLCVDPEDRKQESALLEREGVVRGFEMQLRRRDGVVIWVRDTVRAVRDAESRMLYHEGSLEDITEHKQAEEIIKRLAYHDPLTGLPNRRLLNDRLRLVMAQARRNQQKLAVMLLDLDQFKDVNDALGHGVGDQLLQVVGDRLTSLLRSSDTVARMGGDEFIVLLPEIARLEDAAGVAQKILEDIRRPFEFDGHRLHVSTSIGIAFYPDDGEDGDTLMRNADIAMYRAKNQGRDNYQRYTDVPTD
jgi:diguanylate cyclase (GGDEF)-like protein/PAS domain S-box-containing protein